MLDLLITDATVLDGTGRPGFPADLAVTGGRVVEVGRLAGQQAARVIRAGGRVVSPGFIDMHAHDDYEWHTGHAGERLTKRSMRASLARRSACRWSTFSCSSATSSSAFRLTSYSMSARIRSFAAMRF